MVCNVGAYRKLKTKPKTIAELKESLQVIWSNLFFLILVVFTSFIFRIFVSFTFRTISILSISHFIFLLNISALFSLCARLN